VFTVRPEAARRACELTVIGEVVGERIWMEKEMEGAKLHLSLTDDQ